MCLVPSIESHLTSGVVNRGHETMDERDAQRPDAVAPSKPGNAASGSRAADSGRVGRWLWPVVALALTAAKVHVLGGVLDHRAGAVSLLAVWLAVSLLRIRLVSVAMASAALLGIGLSAHSFVHGAMFGAGALIVLIGCFLAISTALHARQKVAQTRAPSVRSET
jgi:hypothetical protein